MRQLPVAKWLWQRALTTEVLVWFPGGVSYWLQSRLPFRQSVIISQDGKLINFHSMNSLSKSNEGRGKMSNFVFGELGGVCYLLVDGDGGMEQSLVQGQLKFKVMCLEDATIVCSIYLYKSYIYVPLFLLLWPDWQNCHLVTVLHNSTNLMCPVIFFSQL